MSDTSEGPGWWLASDGKWYPPDPPGVPSGSRTNGLAITSLALGILWPGFGSITAIILGHVALRQIRDSNGQEGGRGMAIAGLTIGYIGAAFVALMLLFLLALPGILRTS